MITAKKCEDTHAYVGSTKNFKNRMKKHKYQCNTEKSPHHNVYLYKYIRANGGWDAFDKYILDDFECDDNKQKRMIEQEYINKFGNGLNSNKSYESTQERKEYMKQYQEEYYEAHKEKRKESDKKYREANKERIKAYQKEYRERKKNIQNKI